MPDDDEVVIREPTYYSGEIILNVPNGGRNGASLVWTAYDGGGATINLARHWWAATPDDVRLDVDEVRTLRDALTAIIDRTEEVPNAG